MVKAARFWLLLVSVFLLAGQVYAQDTAPASAWTVRCAEPAEGGDVTAPPVDKSQCEVFQRLVVRDTGQRVSEFAIGFPHNQDAARGVIILPLGIMLEDALEMVVNESSRFRFKVRYCTSLGCYAFVRLNDEILQALKRGNEAVIHGQTLTGETIDITFSLAGFTKAVGKIDGN